MLLVPHIRIARRVNDVMRNKFQIKLSRAVFAFGSIYPDLVKRNRTGYHDCKEALSTVYEYLREKPQSRWAESFRLGMICHYLTDSFCEVHIRHEDYTLRQHLRYERERSRQIKAYLEHAAQAALQAEYPARYAALDSFLEAHQAFTRQKRDFAQECEAAVANCVMVFHGLAPQGKVEKHRPGRLPVCRVPFARRWRLRRQTADV